MPLVSAGCRSVNRDACKCPIQSTDGIEDLSAPNDFLQRIRRSWFEYTNKRNFPPTDDASGRSEKRVGRIEEHYVVARMGFIVDIANLHRERQRPFFPRQTEHIEKQRE